MIFDKDLKNLENKNNTAWQNIAIAIILLIIFTIMRFAS